MVFNEKVSGEISPSDDQLVTDSYIKYLVANGSSLQLFNWTELTWLPFANLDSLKRLG